MHGLIDVRTPQAQHTASQGACAGATGPTPHSTTPDEREKERWMSSSRDAVPDALCGAHLHHVRAAGDNVCFVCPLALIPLSHTAPRACCVCYYISCGDANRAMIAGLLCYISLLCYSNNAFQNTTRKELVVLLRAAGAPPPAGRRHMHETRKRARCGACCSSARDFLRGGMKFDAGPG